jgi:protein CpxP
MKQIVVIVMLGFLGIAFAQDGPEMHRDKKEKLSPEEKANKRTEKMTKVLDLSVDQQEKIKKINLDHASAMESIREEGKKLKEKAKKQKESTKESIEAILTAEQLELMKQKEEERRQKREERCKCCRGE